MHYGALCTRKKRVRLRGSQPNSERGVNLMLGEIPGEEKSQSGEEKKGKKTQDTTFLATHGLIAVRGENGARRSS